MYYKLYMYYMYYTYYIYIYVLYVLYVLYYGTELMQRHTRECCTREFTAQPSSNLASDTTLTRESDL